MAADYFVANEKNWPCVKFLGALGKKAKLYTKKSPRNITQPFGDILMNKITKIITIN